MSRIHDKDMTARIIGLIALGFLVIGGCSSPDVDSSAGETVDQQPRSEFEVLGEGNGLDDAAREALALIIETEDLGLDFSVRLKKLAAWLELESQTASGKPHPEFESIEKATLFAEQDAASCLEDKTALTKAGYLQLAEHATVDSVNPLQALLAIEVHWETIQFGIVSSHFETKADGAIDRNRLLLETKMEARGEHNDGRAYAIKSYQNLTWSRTPVGWELVEWHQLDGKLTETPRTIFREVLAEVVVGDSKDETIARARESCKDQILLDGSVTGEMKIPEMEFMPYFNTTSNPVFPSVSVVDFNNDGHDDLFMTGRWGKTQLLESQGDGTFKESAEEAGLHFENLVNCSLFADFDNDGDKDAIIGRPMKPAMYLRNDDGKFFDVTHSQSDLGEQYFVSGICVSDVNRDGLLDVYLSTYAPMSDDKVWGKRFLGEDEYTRLTIKLRDSHHWINLHGHANVMLMNRGDGRLERVPFDQTISQWRRSYQCAWGDFDSDGDDDLYVCNDFAPDRLLRNDTPKGAANPKFTDATDEVITNKEFGLGMGASWGDFDRDGDLDLYVSNMFSKAGTRIVKQLDSVDPRLTISAAGNFLFENDNHSLIQRAGQKDDQLHVNQIGWSYGGQWADFDNDGLLDLYVPSGYYSAPKEISTKVDT